MERNTLEGELSWYFNFHQHQLVANRINVRILGGADPKETYAKVPVDMPGPGNQRVFTKVTVGEQLEKEKLSEKNQLDVIWAVEEMLVEVTGGKYKPVYLPERKGKK